MGRLRFIVCLLLLAAFLMVFAQSLDGVLRLLKENLPFSTPSASSPVAASAQQRVIDGAVQLSKNVSDQLLRWQQQIAEFSKKLSLADWPELTELAQSTVFPQKEKPQPPAQPQPRPQKPSLLQIMMEDERPPLENKLLGPEISALLDDFLARRREYNTQLLQATQTLFGDEAAQDAIHVLFADETASFANASTCQSPEAFAANQQRIDDQTEKNMLRVFNRYKQELDRPQEKNSPAWKAFFKRVENYKRVAAEGQAATHPPK